jgi:hypothetical protein
LLVGPGHCRRPKLHVSLRGKQSLQFSALLLQLILYCNT